MTFPDQPFSSYFSGNTVQICPVGALTATPYRFKARPWDLAESETTCTTCSVGCRITVQSSRDQLVRYLGVDSDAVNWGWLCDRGRFNFEAVNSDRSRAPNRCVRRRDPGSPRRRGPSRSPPSPRRCAARSTPAGASAIAILGGARGTNEDAFAWARLADALGIDHRDAQLGDGLPAEVLDLPRATIDETVRRRRSSSLGPDLKEELPVLYLRLRDSAVRKRVAAHRAVADGDRADRPGVALGPRRVGRRGRGRRRARATARRRPAARRPGRRSSPAGPTWPSRRHRRRRRCGPCTTPSPPCSPT